MRQLVFQIKILIFVLLSTPYNFSRSESVYVAFLEFYNKDGERISLEPGGRFSHIALSYDGGWIHAFPPRPVEKAARLDKFGRLTVVLELSDEIIVDQNFLTLQLDKSTSIQSEWSDTQTTYCSKLVGQCFGILARPSLWEAAHWDQVPLKYKPTTREGLSPDDVYETLIKSPYLRGKREYRRIKCGEVLRQ